MHSFFESQVNNWWWRNKRPPSVSQSGLMQMLQIYLQILFQWRLELVKKRDQSEKWQTVKATACLHEPRKEDWLTSVSQSLKADTDGVPSMSNPAMGLSVLSQILYQLQSVPGPTLVMSACSVSILPIYTGWFINWGYYRTVKTYLRPSGALIKHYSIIYHWKRRKGAT